MLGYISLLNYAARSMTLKWEDFQQLAIKWQLKAQLMLTAMQHMMLQQVVVNDTSIYQRTHPKRDCPRNEHCKYVLLCDYMSVI